MARNEITFLVNLRKNEVTDSKYYGMYYPEAETKEPLSLRGFARHLAEHGKLATYEMLVLVLQNIVSCMKELVTQGQSVKLDGLGIFYPTIEATKGGAESVEDSLFRMYRNYTDGSLTRVLIGSTPDNTFAPLVIRKSRSEKSRQNILALIELLPLMQGDLVLPKLEKRCQQWLERVRVECMKDDDRVRANQRMRIGVSVMRCLCCMMLCDFGGWLIREIDRRDQKPEWAEGCQTAKEYLQQHPKATEYWLPRKFQKKTTLEAFDTLADYFMDNVLYYFRERIEKAYDHQEEAICNTRRGHGRNDSIYERLPQKFNINKAQQERDDDPTGNRTRSMIKNWVRQGLVRNIAVGEYEKLV